MSRKSYLEQACEVVPEFQAVSDQFLRKYTLAGKSASCTRNYLMQISKLVLHFERSPLDLSQDQLEEYLFYIRQHEKPSLSSFKHLVYGLRTMFSMFKNERLYLSLPPIAQSKALPVVFSQEEVRQILKTPRLLKHRVLFAVIYDCGLRISARFARKLRTLKRQGEITKYVPRDLIKKPWVVYAKQAFCSPESVVEYLGRYSHRVAISNNRILKVTQTHVTFSWLNRKAGSQKETLTLSGVEFLERFLDHIVPPYFRRIRHFGFLSNRNKKQALQEIRTQLLNAHIASPRLSRAEVLALRFGERSVLSCRECGGVLLLLESYPKERAPPEYRCA